MLKQAELSNYIMSIATPAGASQYNYCGMVTSHAYSILSAFEMTDQNNLVHKMIMLRNPWGKTQYNQSWHKADPNWTSDLVLQVPLSIDPRISDAQGIFTVPLELLGPQDGSP